MTRADVKAIFGVPEFDSDCEARIAYFGGFILNFSKTGQVELIELAMSAQFKATFQSIDLHRSKPEEAVAHVSRFDTYDPGDPELGHSYTFRGLQICLWRSTTERAFEAVSLGAAGYFQ